MLGRLLGLLGIGALLLCGAPAQAQQVNMYWQTGSGPSGFHPVSAADPLPITGSISTTVTFPTIGAAVPATGIYNGINVGGTLRGMTGLGLGSTFSPTVAIVDASGNQITTFGSSAAVGATGSAVPASASYGAMNVGGTLTGVPGTANGQLIDINTSSQVHTDLTAPTVAGTNRIGYTSDDPCTNLTKLTLPITSTTAAVKVIATGVAANRIYICQIDLVTTAANNVAVFEATTGTTCATSPVAVYGAGTSVATAANGYPFPANGGIAKGSGHGTVGKTTVNNNDLCIGTSAATPLTGGISYVTAP